MNYPVVGEMWRIFEQSLMISAKKLTEDIAKHQGADPKALWSAINKKIKISVTEVDVPETPSTCPYIIDTTEGIIKQRCRIPCLLGFAACPNHINTHVKDVPTLPPVRRVMDFKGDIYFIDGDVARNVHGVAKGVVENEVLYIFTK